MKILLLRQYNPFVENGASANRFRGLIEGLRHLGDVVDVAVVGGYIKEQEQNATFPGVYYLYTADHYSYWKTRLNKYIFDRFAWRIISKRFRKMDLSSYDIIWLVNNAEILRLFNHEQEHIPCKSFMELNEFNDIYKGAGATGNFLQRLVGQSSEKIFLNTVNKIDIIAVMTKTLLSHYSKMSKPTARFLHLPMTVDLGRFADSQEVKTYTKPYIAYTGTFNNAKDGVDILIKAFGQIAKKHPHIQLYLAGFWHYDVPAQEQIIRELGLTQRIHYVGVLSREQIPPFICQASLLVLSRPDSHQAQGGFPTKLGEYLATGNPGCVTKVGEIPDYLEDNVSAFMATPGDVASFADAMDRALSNLEQAKKVGQKGREVAEKEFNSETQARRLHEFLAENV